MAGGHGIGRGWFSGVDLQGGPPVNRACRFPQEIGAQPSGSAEGVTLTWSAPARLQACSSTWSSSAAAIAAGCAGHLVDQSLARHTQTRHKPPTNTNTSHLVDQLLQLARSRGRPPAPGWPGRPRAARSTRTTYQVRTIAPRPAGHPPPCPEPRRTHQARRSAAGSRTAAGVPGACCRHCLLYTSPSPRDRG